MRFVNRTKPGTALRDHPFKTSACLRGGGVSPLPTFADARGVGVLGLPTSAIFEIINLHYRLLLRKFK